MFAVHTVFIAKENILYVSNIRMSQILFESRFSNINRMVTSITKAELVDPDRDYNAKNIFRVQDRENTHVHRWRGKGHEVHTDDVWFNHYRVNNLMKYRNIDNINQKIKRILKAGSEKYVYKQKPKQKSLQNIKFRKNVVIILR